MYTACLPVGLPAWTPTHPPYNIVMDFFEYHLYVETYYIHKSQYNLKWQRPHFIFNAIEV